MSQKIYIVEDDASIRELESYALKSAGFETLGFENSRDFFAQMESHLPDLILLDIMLPVMDGWAVGAKIRETSKVPIIMLTAKGEDTDKVLGLNVGADDYITKPFNPVEMLARVRSQLRRYMQLGGGAVKDSCLRLDGICLDDRSKEVTVDGEKVNLTPTEYDILKLLMEHPGEVFPPKVLYQRVWNDEPYGAESTVAVHIRHIREKIEINPAEPRYLKAVWGQGYKIERGKT